jgi:hypothetical protein
VREHYYRAIGPIEEIAMLTLQWTYWHRTDLGDYTVLINDNIELKTKQRWTYGIFQKSPYQARHGQTNSLLRAEQMALGGIRQFCKWEDSWDAYHGYFKLEVHQQADGAYCWRVLESLTELLSGLAQTLDEAKSVAAAWLDAHVPAAEQAA